MSKSPPVPARPANPANALLPVEEKPPEEILAPSTKHWGWILLVWTFVGTLRATQRFLRGGDLQPDLAYSWWGALGNNLFLAYLWAGLTPGVMAIARRFAPGRVPLSRLVPIHVVCACGVALLHTVLSHLLYKLFLAPEVTWAEFARNFAASALMTGPTRISTYLEIVGVTWGLDYYRVFREREIRASNLQAQLAEARLEALKLQLRPAFVFNALNTILPLIYRNAQAAARTVVQLGDLLRLSLKSGATQLVPVEEEVHFLQLYLQIEKTRLADRLSVSFDVAADAASGAIPNLILQPLVENAVARAAATAGGTTTISIGARRAWDSLRFEIRDDAREVPQDAAARAAHDANVARTRRRLDHLYGETYRFEAVPGATGGLHVILTVPFAPTGPSQDQAARGALRRAPAPDPLQPEGVRP